MESIFHLNESDRAAFLQHIMQSFGCTYICLWSHSPQPPHYLYYMDGLYHEESNQASSPSGSLAMRLFIEYQKSLFMTDNHNGGVPGLAFKNSLPYIELKELDLSRLASNTVQLQFYQGARIKTAIFMGCKAGEIELGMPNDSQVNLETEMMKWFPEDFSQQALPQQSDQNRPSSSSSSLRSLSMDSNSEQYSPFPFNIPNTSSYMPELPLTEAPFEQALRPISSAFINPLRQALTLSQFRRTQFPTIEGEEAAMTKAILAVISSSPSPSPSSSTSSHQPQKASAFKSYRSSLAPTTQIPSRFQRQNLFKRSISFFRSLGLIQAEAHLQGTRPTSNQLHHMISERRRREKLNESFQALRSLLPPGSKRDKASVLTNTIEYLTSLKAQVEELSKRKQMLEAQLPRKVALVQEASSFSTERLNVRIRDIAESTSEARIVDLEVNVRGEGIMLDLVIRVLEFLKKFENVSVMSVESETRLVETTSANRMVLRLRIQGGEWDESGFQEAVIRVVDDLAK